MGSKIKSGLLILALVGLLTAGYSFAYFTDDTKVDAKFITGVLKTDFEGAPQIDLKTGHVDNRKVSWSVTNTGNNDLYLRVKPIDVSDLGDGDVMIRAIGGTWKHGKDGYYYYPNVVAPQETVEFRQGVFFDTWETVYFPVDIEVEAIQASNNAVKEMWPDTPIK